MVTSPSTTHPDAWPLSVKREANATGKNYMAAETFCGQHDQWDGESAKRLLLKTLSQTSTKGNLISGTSDKQMIQGA
jgi:hypothetical protein